MTGVLLRGAESVRVLAERPPTEEWLDATLVENAEFTWSEFEVRALAIADQSAQLNRWEAMEGWLNLGRWARLLGSNQQNVNDRWINALNSARLGHRNMPLNYSAPDEPMSALLSAEFVRTLMIDADFSASFFDLLTPYDHLPSVFRILAEIHAQGFDDFRSYGELALAIALVFDVPPPPQWPHGQVSGQLLPRTLGDPRAAFHFWVEADRRRQTLHRLSAMRATELKFVVDAAAPLAELIWSRKSLETTFDNLPRAYDAINYRMDRIERGRYSWPGNSYALPAILEAGGICVDQGYFASQVGKASGVPTLLFLGAGLDGRHAWFGFLDGRGNWQMDVGRYAEQKFVAGMAFDPQTWKNVNDHELAFLSERFHVLPRFRQSMAWAQMAREYLRNSEFVAALAAAKKASGLEPRNVAAWEILVMAERANGVKPAALESTLRRAARALQNYPDLYARFMRAAIAAMRERGQISRALHEERMLARKFTGDRSDIALTEAAAMLNRSIANDDPASQLRVFESVLRQFGVGAGMEAFDRLVRPIHDHLIERGEDRYAFAVVVIARKMLPIAEGSQFDLELRGLERRAR